jgi:hypothetical protein
MVNPNHSRNPRNLVHFPYIRIAFSALSLLYFSLSPGLSFFFSFYDSCAAFFLSDFQAESARCHEQKMTNIITNDKIDTIVKYDLFLSKEK